MTTVRALLREREELKMREHVWSSVREHLEGFLPEGGEATELVIDGVSVPENVVIDVLGDIESDCLEPIRDRLRSIEASKVEDGKAKKEKPKAASTKKRAGRKSC